MTDEEALALKEGGRVEALYGRRWFVADVLAVCDWRSTVRGLCPFGGSRPITIAVRKTGRGKGGRCLSSCHKTPAELRGPRILSTASANVYADWLDEHGEQMAAHKLRRAFPLDPCVRE